MVRRFCKRCGEEFKPSRDFHNFCWECYRAAHGDASNEVHAHAAPFDAVEIRWILQLVHPDKHQNSVRANHVTATLLRMRGGNK